MRPNQLDSQATGPAAATVPRERRRPPPRPPRVRAACTLRPSRTGPTAERARSAVCAMQAAERSMETP